MFKKIINFIFLISQAKDHKSTYYRMANINGENGCIQANISKKMAEKFNAIPGKCSDINCYIYRGKGNIPFCCTVNGYACNDFI